MTALPKRSGSASASTPGNPANASILFSSGKLTGPRRLSGSLRGEISRPPRRKGSSYSNVILPSSSSTTAPTNLFQIQTCARASTLAIGWLSSALAWLSLPLHQLNWRYRGRGKKSVEVTQPTERAQESHQGRELGILAELGVTYRGSTGARAGCELRLREVQLEAIAPQASAKFF